MSNLSILWIVIGVIFVLYLIYLAFYLRTAKKLDALSAILAEKQDPDGYIREVCALLDGKRSAQWKSMRNLNLAIAYEEKRDFQKAEELLRQVKPSSITMVNRGVYWTNLALVCFYRGKEDEACRIMDQKKSEFRRQSNFEQQKGKLAVLSIFYSLAKHDRKNAREQYARARKKWTGPAYAAHFQYLGKELNAVGKR